MKYVYRFSEKIADGDASMLALLGSKGANLAEMLKIGVSVPPGFTLTTSACSDYYKNKKSLSSKVKEEIALGVAHLEEVLGRKFSGPDATLFISVRSGAAVSMPGMMDTILNLGINDQSIISLSKLMGDERFAYDSYRRFIQMYSSIVLGLDLYEFEKIYNYHKRKNSITNDSDLTTNVLLEIIIDYKALILKRKEIEFPQNPWEQLWYAIGAVFDSSESERAKKYRMINGIKNDLGTAANIQAMVFGNSASDSATGVMFTRNPSTGQKRLFGEFLLNAQGEDIVSGSKTPGPISVFCKSDFGGADLESLEEKMPERFQELEKIAEKLELHYRDMQDIEFTIENGKLWILQTRSGKRSAKANLKITLDMFQEGLITKQEAILRITPKNLEQLIHPTIDPKANNKLITKGLPASPGAASGIIVFSSKAAEEFARNTNVILVRHETSPEDIAGMNVSAGILTARGGMTSHAAVVARSMGKPCVCGASALLVDSEKKLLQIDDLKLKEGDWITINGATGDVILGEAATIINEESTEYAELMALVDEQRTMGVMANAETVRDAKAALKFGADGIGLCRTEHMFFAEDRIYLMRRMILAKDKAERLSILEELMPHQKQDFFELFSVMNEKQITIRLLDPPLHEFLPLGYEEMLQFANTSGYSLESVKLVVDKLEETNPMLGHRGSRLAVTYPEIYSMQVTAILLAAHEFNMKYGAQVVPEIMVPFIMNLEELLFIKKIVFDAAKDLGEKVGQKVNFLFGTMIELPRLALVADEIAKEVDFCSFGTNDLTQMVMGISRDDCGKFLQSYIENNLLEKDPFVSLDINGVGELVRIAVTKAKAANRNIKLGVCGEHGGDADSIKIFSDLGLDYVSCSPYRILIARLASAQVAIPVQNDYSEFTLR